MTSLVKHSLKSGSDAHRKSTNSWSPGSFMYAGNDLVDIWLGVLRGRLRGRVVRSLARVVDGAVVLVADVTASVAAHRRMQVANEKRTKTMVTARIGSYDNKKRRETMSTASAPNRRQHARRTHTLMLMLPLLCELLLLLLLPPLLPCGPGPPCRLCIPPTMKGGGAARMDAGNATSATRTGKRTRACERHEVGGPWSTFRVLLAEHGGRTMEEEAGLTFMSGVVKVSSSQGHTAEKEKS